ncbi:MAG: VWA domain-containing protein, partial [Ktedonobacterales bacterium]|nr:VWA domain-containing protein [Ktedonobacterales bacterium]
AYIDLSGVGDFIGVVGLDNSSGATGGPRNFPLAQNWADPADMSTLQARQALKQAIYSKSNQCRPNANTPTYDALSQALSMLQAATQGGKSGSVILLTDGVPAPSPSQQGSAIQSDLVPQFKARNWPVDTVALGADPDGSFHTFLNGITSATSGTFYDDAHGDVPGVSPLNIAPFFVKIFELRHAGVTTRRDIAPTQLQGGVTARNFDVTDYVKSLAVIVVIDQSSTRATLRTPTGQAVNVGSGVQVATDPHYVIFNIDQPQAGTWELDVSGSGEFLMYSAKVSAVGVAITAPAANGKALALGQSLTITANLTNDGQPVTDHHFTLQGQLAFSGGTGQYAQGFALDDNATPGTFAGNVQPPITAPAGTYTLLVNASGASGAAVVASASMTVRIQLFPEPLLYGAQKSPTREAVSATVTQ